MVRPKGPRKLGIAQAELLHEITSLGFDVNSTFTKKEIIGIKTTIWFLGASQTWTNLVTFGLLRRMSCPQGKGAAQFQLTEEAVAALDNWMAEHNHTTDLFTPQAQKHKIHESHRL